MTDLAVRGTQFSPDLIVKLDKDKIRKASQEAASDGLDNVFFKAGNDVFVASGKGMNIGKIEVDNVFDFNGEKATVIAINNESNTLKEHLTNGGSAAGAVGIIGGIWSGLLTFAGATSGVIPAKELATTVATKGILPTLAIGTAVGIGVTAISHFSQNKENLDRMLDYGKEVNSK